MQTLTILNELVLQTWMAILGLGMGPLLAIFKRVHLRPTLWVTAALLAVTRPIGGSRTSIGEKWESMKLMSVGGEGDEIRSDRSQRVCGRAEDLEVTWGRPRAKWTKAKADVGLGGVGIWSVRFFWGENCLGLG